MTTNEFLQQNPGKVEERLYSSCFPVSVIRPAMHLADGTVLSVQASEAHFCTPRENGVSEYSAVEIGYPSQVIPELLKYAEEPENPTGCIYYYVPVEVLDKVIEERGGIVF